MYVLEVGDEVAEAALWEGGAEGGDVWGKCYRKYSAGGYADTADDRCGFVPDDNWVGRGVGRVWSVRVDCHGVAAWRLVVAAEGGECVGRVTGAGGDAVAVGEVEGGRVEEVRVRVVGGRSVGVAADIAVHVRGAERGGKIAVGVSVYGHVDHRDDHGQEKQRTEDVAALAVGCGDGAVVDVTVTVEFVVLFFVGAHFLY